MGEAVTGGKKCTYCLSGRQMLFNYRIFIDYLIFSAERRNFEVVLQIDCFDDIWKGSIDMSTPSARIMKHFQQQTLLSNIHSLSFF